MTVMVTSSEVIERLNQKLASEEIRVCETNGDRMLRMELGRFYLVVRGLEVMATDIDLESLARVQRVLKRNERMEN